MTRKRRKNPNTDQIFAQVVDMCKSVERSLGVLQNMVKNGQTGGPLLLTSSGWARSSQEKPKKSGEKVVGYDRKSGQVRLQKMVDGDPKNRTIPERPEVEEVGAERVQGKFEVDSLPPPSASPHQGPQ